MGSWPLLPRRRRLLATAAYIWKNFCPRCTHTQLQILQRYHCQAIMGLLGEWTEEDTQRLDEIVHTVYHIMTAEIPPWDC